MNMRPAFTYVEITIVALVVAIITVTAIPDGDTADNEQGRTISDRFAGDTAYVRSLNIAQPGNPAIIKVDGATNRYWIARAATPDTPILHPRTKKPYLVQAGAGGDRGLETVRIVGLDFDGDQVLGFDSTGMMDQDTPALLQVTSGGSSYELHIDSYGTGSSVATKFSQNLSVGGTSGAGMTFGTGYDVGTTFAVGV